MNSIVDDRRADQGSAAPGRHADDGSERSARRPQVVIVDPDCSRYGSFVEAARAGEIGLHFCVDGAAAMRLAHRFRADVWLVPIGLQDFDGFDLAATLLPRLRQAATDSLIGDTAQLTNDVGRAGRDSVYLIATHYRLEDEQQALASGCSGYLVDPVDADLLLTVRGT